MKNVWKKMTAGIVCAGMLAMPVSAMEIQGRLTLEELYMEELNGLLDGSELLVNVRLDTDAFLADAALTYNGDQILSAQVYSDLEDIYVALPELTDTVYRLDGEQTAQMLLESYNAEMLIDDTGSAALPAAFADIDYGALAERWMEYCGEALTGLSEDMSIFTVENQDFEIGGETVSCPGAGITVPSSAVVDLADASVAFAAQDEECASLLRETMDVDISENAEELRSELREALESSLTDMNVALYQTEEGDLVSLEVYTTPLADGSQVSFGLSGNGDVLSGTSFYSVFEAADGDEADSLRLENSFSYDETTGAYTLGSGAWVNGLNEYVVKGSGTSLLTDGGFDFTCDQFEIQLENEISILLSGALSMDKGDAEIAFDTAGAVDVLNLTEEELEAEGNALSAGLISAFLPYILAAQSSAE